MLNIQQTFYTK